MLDMEDNDLRKRKKRPFTRKPATTSGEVRKNILEVIRLTEIPEDYEEAKKLTRDSTYQEVYEAIPGFLIASEQFHRYHRLYILTIERWKTKAISSFTDEDRWSFKNELKALYLQTRDEPSPSTYSKIENEIDKVFRFADAWKLLGDGLKFSLGTRSKRTKDEEPDTNFDELFPGILNPKTDPDPKTDWTLERRTKPKTEDEQDFIRDNIAEKWVVWFWKGQYAREVSHVTTDAKKRKLRVHFEGSKRSVKVSTLFAKTYEVLPPDDCHIPDSYFRGRAEKA